MFYLKMGPNPTSDSTLTLPNQTTDQPINQQTDMMVHRDATLPLTTLTSSKVQIQLHFCANNGPTLSFIHTAAAGNNIIARFCWQTETPGPICFPCQRIYLPFLSVLYIIFLVLSLNLNCSQRWWCLMIKMTNTTTTITTTRLSPKSSFS